MDRFRRAGTLSLGVFVGLAMSGCAGVHRHMAGREMTGVVPPRDGGVHVHTDPFTPSPDHAVGLGRYFPGLGRPKSPEPAAEVARSGFRLFKRHAADEAHPDGGEPRPARAQDPSPIERAGTDPTPSLPLALVAEVDPAALNPGRAALIAARSQGSDEGSGAMDAEARRVQAGLDDVLPRSPEPPAAPTEPSSASTPTPTPTATLAHDPFAEFDLKRSAEPTQPAVAEPTPPPSAPSTSVEPPTPAEPPTSGDPNPVSAPDEGEEPNPFAELDLPPPPTDAELFGDQAEAAPDFEPRPTSSPVLGPAGRPLTQRYGHSTVPISRRLAPPPEPDPADIYGRPRLPLVRPRQDTAPAEPPPARLRQDAVSAELPPVTFPPAYYEGQGGPQPPPQPAGVRAPEPQGRKRWFSRSRLFRRWRGGSQDEQPVVEPGLVGPESDDVPQGR